MNEEKYKLSRLITYLYETMNGELALDYANLDSENIEILLDYIEKLENIIKEAKENNQYIIDVINDIEDGNRLVELLNENNDILNKVDRNE